MKLFSARLSSTNQDLKIMHHAHVFVSRSADMAIVATQHFSGKGGVLYEEKEPSVITGELDPEIVGKTLSTALKRTSIAKLEIIGKRKLTDWPAFRVSKAASVRQFEQNFIGIQASGANEFNLVYVITGEPYKNAELRVTSSVSSGAPPDEVGRVLIAVFRACRDRQV